MMIFIFSLKIRIFPVDSTGLPLFSAYYFFPSAVIYLYIHYTAFVNDKKLRLQNP